LGALSPGRETTTGLKRRAPRAEDTGIQAGARDRGAVWPDPLMAASEGVLGTRVGFLGVFAT